MKNFKLVLILALMIGVGGFAFNNCSDVGFSGDASAKATSGPGDGGDDVGDNGEEGDGEGDDPRCSAEAVEAGRCALLCHIPPGNPEQKHTLRVGAPAVQAHVGNHGDYLGECQEDEEPESDLESQ